MPACHLRHDRARRKRFRDDAALVLVTPPRPSTNATANSTRFRGAQASTIWSTIFANRSCQHGSHLPNYAALGEIGAKHTRGQTPGPGAPVLRKVITEELRRRVRPVAPRQRRQFPPRAGIPRRAPRRSGRRRARHRHRLCTKRRNGPGGICVSCPARGGRGGPATIPPKARGGDYFIVSAELSRCPAKDVCVVDRAILRARTIYPCDRPPAQHIPTGARRSAQQDAPHRYRICTVVTNRYDGLSCISSRARRSRSRFSRKLWNVRGPKNRSCHRALDHRAFPGDGRNGHATDNMNALAQRQHWLEIETLGAALDTTHWNCSYVSIRAHSTRAVSVRPEGRGGDGIRHPRRGHHFALSTDRRRGGCCHHLYQSLSGDAERCCVELNTIRHPISRHQPRGLG